MIVREFAGVTYVLLDFEGLGSFERSAQEDMLLSAKASELLSASCICLISIDHFDAYYIYA